MTASSPIVSIALHRAGIQVRVAGVEAEPQTGQARLLQKMAQVGGCGHFAGSVFKRKRDATLLGEERQMFERAERRIPAARIGGVARSTQMQNHNFKLDLLGNVNRALDFVHGVEPPDALEIGNAKQENRLRVQG